MTGRTILIVDDNQAIRDLITTLLELSELDVSVVAVSTAGAALESWRNDRPAAIVLDRLLGADDGLDVASRVLGEQPTLPIVLFTAFLDDSLRRQAADVGVTACITQDDLQRLPDLLGELLA